FSGMRSVFQWTIGNLSKIGGVHNAMDFSINDSANLEIGGQIGLFSNGSQIGVHLALDSVVNSTAGTNFTCSNNFALINGNHACFSYNYTLISNAVYYLDVEIQNRSVRGYISTPQSNRSDIYNTNLKRTLIGEINWKNELMYLSPQSYWVANYYGDSCKNLSAISTFNFVPVSYNNVIKKMRSFYSSNLFDTTLCGPQNLIGLTNFAHNVTMSISRPPAI
ncbi:hypothetical protein KR093_010322, partial [Drosophila rubida]